MANDKTKTFFNCKNWYTYVCVNHHVSLTVLRSCKTFLAHFTLKRFIAGVHRLVPLNVGYPTESFAADRTRKWFFIQVIIKIWIRWHIQRHRAVNLDFGTSAGQIVNLENIQDRFCCKVFGKFAVFKKQLNIDERTRCSRLVPFHGFKQATY